LPLRIDTDAMAGRSKWQKNILGFCLPLYLQSQSSHLVSLGPELHKSWLLPLYSPTPHFISSPSSPPPSSVFAQDSLPTHPNVRRNPPRKARWTADKDSLKAPLKEPEVPGPPAPLPASLLNMGWKHVPPSNSEDVHMGEWFQGEKDRQPRLREVPPAWR